MMVKSILDTDILSEYLKGRHPAVISPYAQTHGVFTLTSITVYEIVYGLELKAASSQLKRALAWLNQNEEITPTSADYPPPPRSRRRREKTVLLSNFPTA